MLDSAGLTLSPLLPLAALVALASLLVTLRLRSKYQKLSRALRASTLRLEQLQTAFERFAPEDIVEEVIRHGGVRRHAARREVTVMFIDIVGFTSISEELEPERVVELLNGYFRVVSRAITAHRGRVAKFIGDGVMATFGAPEPNPWQALDATRAGLAIKRGIREYGDRLAERELPRIEVGVGVHKGPAVAGVLGSDELAEYTVIGDTVNTASRVEGLSHAPPYPLLISGAVQRELDERFTLRPLPTTTVKGRQAPVELFAVERFDDDGELGLPS